MIDDITVAFRLPVGRIPASLSPTRSPPGRPPRWGVAGRHGLYVTLTPGSPFAICTVRINVPRVKHHHGVNYPLVNLSSVNDLPLKDISLEVLDLLGVRVSAFGSKATDMLRLPERAVQKVSFTADLHVSDPIACIPALDTLKRKYAAKVTLEGEPQKTTIRWGKPSSCVSIQSYVKAAEIRSHIFRASSAPEKSVLDAMANEALGVLRFEVTLKNSTAIRRFWPHLPHGRLPTLAFMCDPRISKWALTDYAHRLRLWSFLDPHPGQETPSVDLFVARIRRVGQKLLDAQRRLAIDGGSLGRRKSLTADHLRDLAFTSIFGAAYDRDALCELAGWSRSTVFQHTQELAELGLAPDSSNSGLAHVLLHEIAVALDPHTNDDLGIPNLLDWQDRCAFVRTPWSDDDGANDDDLPPSELTADFSDLLHDVAPDEPAYGLALDSAADDVGFDDDIPAGQAA